MERVFVYLFQTFSFQSSFSPTSDRVAQPPSPVKSIVAKVDENLFTVAKVDENIFTVAKVDENLFTVAKVDENLFIIFSQFLIVYFCNKWDHTTTI